ncbi:MAG: ADP-ribosylglycohydrolase family protein [Myxococcales bacterium]|nr:ADP-ribosylglycohydrolase family protein [Myxococcales bacterium]MCB9531923.1 ADP-ribosylglycohydrolase family protein [Myxococcales bacterium]MCB9533891.1 ADP-ribosylglycohydrolase family protein [Myxococcales bacterium]
MSFQRVPQALSEFIRPDRDKDDGMTSAAVDAGLGPRRPTFVARDRLTGLLIGGAVGDALGMPVEGLENELTLRAIHRLGGIRDFLAPQAHVLKSLRRLRPGCWTDETQLTLAITRAILRAGTLDYDAIAEAHVHAFETLELRGWEPTTKQACRRLAQGTHRSRSGKLGGATNAVAAKIAPVAAWSTLQGEGREELLKHCVAVGVMTHNDPRAIVGAYLIALLVRDALVGSRKWAPSPERYEELIEEARWAEGVLTPTIGASEDPISKHLDELSDALDSDSLELAEFCNGATSYVNHSVSYVVALLCGKHWEFEDGVIAAVNGGGDTDTNAAMVGTILGAAYGIRKLPKRFTDKVEEVEILREVGAEFARLF